MSPEHPVVRCTLLVGSINEALTIRRSFLLIKQACLLCPTEGGAFKQTSMGHWAHLLCAIWIPEVGVGNSVWMEPIDGIEGISRQRWRLVRVVFPLYFQPFVKFEIRCCWFQKCSLCRMKVGACIQCDNKSCYTAFHVSCAREAGYLGSMKSYGGEEDNGKGLLKAWCPKHAPVRLSIPALSPASISSTKTEIRLTFKNFQNHLLESNAQKLALYPKTSSSSKSARAHANQYRPPPPRVPSICRDNILAHIAKIPLQKKQHAVEECIIYWCLKREARRGVPLLKRLQTEVSLILFIFLSFCFSFFLVGWLIELREHLSLFNSKASEPSGFASSTD